ncbi:MAG: hypothetical protein H0X29_07815 [Parachlamydiaceae bacterium]|nr:hypothetical protein [Parachlamydiaceae bacterium]
MLRRGLVRCVTESQAEIVRAVAEQNNVPTTLFFRAITGRTEEIEHGLQLNEYYEKNNIFSGNEPIQLKPGLMDFSEYPEEAETLKTMTFNLVEAMNDQISKASPEDSIKQRRYVYISINKPPFGQKSTELINKAVQASSYEDEQYYEATYLGCIIKKMIDLKMIYRIVKRNGHGYYLQA